MASLTSNQVAPISSSSATIINSPYGVPLGKQLSFIQQIESFGEEDLAQEPLPQDQLESPSLVRRRSYVTPSDSMHTYNKIKRNKTIGSISAMKKKKSFFRSRQESSGNIPYTSQMMEEVMTLYKQLNLYRLGTQNECYIRYSAEDNNHDFALIHTSIKNSTKYGSLAKLYQLQGKYHLALVQTFSNWELSSVTKIWYKTIFISGKSADFVFTTTFRQCK